MKKTIIISTIIATILTLVLAALHDLETVLTIILIPVLIGLIALTIGTVWNGIVEIKAEIKRNRKIR